MKRFIDSSTAQPEAFTPSAPQGRAPNNVPGHTTRDGCCLSRDGMWLCRRARTRRWPPGSRKGRQYPVGAPRHMIRESAAASGFAARTSTATRTDSLLIQHSSLARRPHRRAGAGGWTTHRARVRRMGVSRITRSGSSRGQASPRNGSGCWREAYSSARRRPVEPL